MQDSAPRRYDSSPVGDGWQQATIRLGLSGWLGMAVLMGWVGEARLLWAHPKNGRQPPKQKPLSPVLQAFHVPWRVSYPRVHWLLPDPLMHSAAQQVQGQETLTLSYRFAPFSARYRVYLVYRNLASQHFNHTYTIPIQRWTQYPKQGQGLFRWSLQHLPFGPGDLVEYFVEVRGERASFCSPPGRTSRRYLKFFSPVELHSQTIQRERRLLRHMILFLADLLEIQMETTHTWLSHASQRNRATRSILNEMKQILRNLRQDKMASRYSVRAMTTLFSRFSHRTQQRALWQQHLQKNSSLLLVPTFQKHVREQIRQEVRAQEDDVLAIRKLLHFQDMDFMDGMKRQLLRAHQRVKLLALRHQQIHQPASKKALSGALHHLDRLLRQVHFIK